jgi:hypothetical protein
MAERRLMPGELPPFPGNTKKELFMYSNNVVETNRVRTRGRWEALRRLAFVLVPVAVVSVCAITSAQVSPNTANDRSSAAIAHFWAIFHGNDYIAIPKVQAELQEAVERDPENVTLQALLGATHFWHVGEYTRDPNPNMTVLQQDMPTAVQLFQNALNLDDGPHPAGYTYNDHLPGFLGVTTVHLGQMTGNSTLMAQGDQMLNYSIYQFPEFNNFNRWAAHNSDPNTSTSYQAAFDSLWQAIDACVGTTLDRANPDLKPYLYLQTSVGRKSACWSENAMAPHSFEGFMLNLGNALVKAAQVDAAKIVYANAQYASNYATWPYRSVLESIAASDLNARAALYNDNNPANDPPLAVPNRSCVYCHATVAEPAIQ